MIDELDLEELTRPGAMIPVDLMTTAALVKHVLLLREALYEARLQIEYLEAKFQPTGTSAAILARIEAVFKEGGK